MAYETLRLLVDAHRLELQVEAQAQRKIRLDPMGRGPVQTPGKHGWVVGLLRPRPLSRPARDHPQGDACAESLRGAA
jgi:hypothetical protein